MYLLYSGLAGAAAGRALALQVGGLLRVERPRRLFAMGATTSLLNLKLALVFLSLLPQFIDATARAGVPRRSLALGAGADRGLRLRRSTAAR